MLDKFFVFFAKRRIVGTTLKWALFSVFAFGLLFTYLWQSTAVNYTNFGISLAFGGNDTLNDFMVYMWWFILPASLICVFRLLGYRDIKTLRWLNAIFAFPIGVIGVSVLPKLIQYVTGGGTADAGIIGTAGTRTADMRLAVIGLSVLVITLLVVSSFELIYSFLYNENADTKGKKFFARVWAVIKENYTIGYRGVACIALALVGALLCTMPFNTLFAISGKGDVWFSYKLGQVHRILCYLAFIFPIAIYLCSFWQSDKARRLISLFMAWGLMFVYGADWYLLDTINNPFELPLHLCNTIMYVIPVVLTFKLNGVFYFTLFINVFGAFAAMFFPTDGDSMRYLLEPSVIKFWVNHWTAFFMPIVCISLGQFPRPKLRHFLYSMAGFAVYFGLVLFLNPLFTAMGHEKDYFFLNSDQITSVLGKWAEDLRLATRTVTVWGYKLEFFPRYQIAFFFTYCGLAVGMWFLYEILFKSVDGLALSARVWQKVRLDRFALVSQLGGRKVTEPVDIKGVEMIQIKHFSKRYGSSKDYAVRDISLEVNAGEVFGFLGPNGAGKSTVIKSMVGIQSITEGEINICGFDMEKQPIEAKRQIGFVPDNYALYEKLTGREYINYFADIYKVSREDRTDRIEKMIDDLEIRYAFDSQIRTYSHGMKQKIAIMSALIHDPKVWILDEPMTGLDPNSVFVIKKAMTERAKQGNIVFFSSHIIDLVERVCDRIAIIKKGKIAEVIAVKDILAGGVTLEDYYMKKIGFKGAERGVLEKGEVNPFAGAVKKQTDTSGRLEVPDLGACKPSKGGARAGKSGGRKKQ
jgi:ABC-2 type transport system ATP-binding protein